MRTDIVIACVSVVFVFFFVVVGVSFNSYMHRGQEHVPTPQETFYNECIRRGGSPGTRTGYEGDVYINQLKCEGAQ